MKDKKCDPETVIRQRDLGRVCFMKLRYMIASMLLAAFISGCGEDSIETISRTKTPEEIYLMARDYINGYDHEISHDKAFLLYSMAAERGYPPAEYMIASLYHTGSMVEADMDKAADYYIRAADHGIVEAQCVIGGTLFENNGLKVSEDVALDNLMKAAVSDSKAKTQLAYLYLTGTYVRKNVKRGLELLNEAVKYNEPRALVALSSAYINGDFGVEKDYYKGISLLNIAVAQHDNLEALIAYSDLYMNGKGVAADERRGLDYLRQAAERDSIQAQYLLGSYYWKHQDYAKSVHWLTLAAGNGMTPAQEQLGYLYANGLGVEQNEDTAIEWYEKASLRGSSSARYQLAVLLSHKADRADRISELVSDLAELARTGDLSAIKKLYYLYAGSRSPELQSGAEEYLQKILDSKNMELITQIAKERFSGSVNLYADKDLAFRLMNYAAMSGYTPAQIQLADWYRAGEIQNEMNSEENNSMNAYIWYSIAAERDGTAKNSRRNIHLRKDEVQRANSEINRLKKEINNK